jgi:cytochrome bd-type quinol oxidase subunit 1
MTMMRLVIGVENMKSYFFSFAKTYDLIFRFNRALGNASGKLMMVKLGVDGS